MSTTDDRRAAAAGRRRILLYGSLFLALAAALIVRFVLAYEPGVTFTEAPEETRGLWTTSNPRYAGRAFEVTATNVVLHIGDAEAIDGRLVIARELIDNDERILRLEYETAAGPDALEIVPRPGGTMFLRNQPDIVWTVREGTGYRPPPPTVVDVNRPSRLPSLFGPVALVALLLSMLLGGLLLLIRALPASEAVDASIGMAPKLVRGVWTTMDSRFEGQSIRITPNYGFAQFGPGDVRDGGQITDVKEFREDGTRIVSLQYLSREGPRDLEMIIDRAGHMRLRQGPKSVWVRREAS